jgi:hypothetical protein
VATQQTPVWLFSIDTRRRSCLSAGHASDRSRRHLMTLGKYRSDEPFCCRRGNGRAGRTATHRHMHCHRRDGRHARIERNYIIRRDASAWMDMRGRHAPSPGVRHGCHVGIMGARRRRRGRAPSAAAASVLRGPASGWLESDSPCGHGRAHMSPEDGYGTPDTQNRQTKR